MNPSIAPSTSASSLPSGTPTLVPTCFTSKLPSTEVTSYPSFYLSSSPSSLVPTSIAPTEEETITTSSSPSTISTSSPYPLSPSNQPTTIPIAKPSLGVVKLLITSAIEIQIQNFTKSSTVSSLNVIYSTSASTSNSITLSLATENAITYAVLLPLKKFNPIDIQCLSSNLLNNSILNVAVMISYDLQGYDSNMTFASNLFHKTTTSLVKAMNDGNFTKDLQYASMIYHSDVTLHATSSHVVFDPFKIEYPTSRPTISSSLPSNRPNLLIIVLACVAGFIVFVLIFIFYRYYNRIKKATNTNTEYVNASSFVSSQPSNLYGISYHNTSNVNHNSTEDNFFGIDIFDFSGNDVQTQVMSPDPPSYAEFSAMEAKMNKYK